MAKRPAATNGALSRIASQNKKQATESRPKKSKVPKTAAPVAESLFDEKAGSEDDEDVWGDESDVQMNNAPIIEGKTGKKSKKAVAEPSQEDGNESSEDDSDSEGNGFDLARLDESDSESELEDNKEDGADKEEAEEEEEEEEEEIDVDDLSIGNSSDEEEIAATTRVRQTINNKPGLLAALRRINLDVSSSVPFAFHQSVVSSTPTADAIPSVDDDLQRELAFMNQSLEAALKARTLLCKEGVPFTRPTDYFAETVRSDETMEKVKAKMIDVATAKKAAAEARKQRDLKKFGKQVQVAKQQERAKQKKETLDKIHLLKKKRKEGASSALGTNEADDLFDVAVEKELGKSTSSGVGKKRSFSAGDHGGGPNAKRQKKDVKYGFGGKKRHSKSGDAISSGDMSSFSAKRMKSGGGSAGGKKFKAPRPGKARRKVTAGRK